MISVLYWQVPPARAGMYELWCGVVTGYAMRTGLWN